MIRVSNLDDHYEGYGEFLGMTPWTVLECMVDLVMNWIELKCYGCFEHGHNGWFGWFFFVGCAKVEWWKSRHGLYLKNKW